MRVIDDTLLNQCKFLIVLVRRVVVSLRVRLCVVRCTVLCVVVLLIRRSSLLVNVELLTLVLV